MKKLLLLLLCVSLVLLNNSCSTSSLTPNLEQNIIDKIWEVKDGTERFYLDSEDGKLYIKDYLCNDFSAIGDYNIIDNSITYNYDSSSFQITKLFHIIDNFSANEISCLYDVSTNSAISIIYNKVDPAIWGCADANALNYNPNVDCGDNAIECIFEFTGQQTFIPDDNFERELIQLGYDYVLDDYAYSVDTITSLELSPSMSYQITDLTGIEDFTSLTYLNCEENQLTSLDVSNNTALTFLNCTFNQLTSLDVSGATVLTDLQCAQNQLTSLDVSGATALTDLDCGGNDLTSLDVSGATALTDLDCRSNQLNSLDVSNNTALTYLNCITNQLNSLDVRNGNNINLNTFYTLHNPNLTCVNVDDTAWSTSNWTNIDPQHYFSLTCP